MKNCTHVLRALLCASVIFTTAISPAQSQIIETGINCSNGDYLGFLEYKPVGYATEGNVKHPLIIFLHGIGERGNGTTELKTVGRVGLPRVIREGHPMTFTWNGKTETFLVLMPQCPTKYGMWPQLFVTELINYAKKNLRIDTNRIYLTGLSMGGGGSLRYISTAAAAPKTVAATATICAPCTFDNGQYVADAKLPLWVFHAADDDVAVASCSDRAYNRTLAANPEVKPLRTVWPTGGHLVWDRVYTDTNYKYDGTLNIYEWFLGQNKSLPVNKLPVARATGTTQVTTGSAVATLTGSTSTDADGKILRYVWKKLSGPNAGTILNRFGPNATTQITGLTVAGNYVYELSVVDDRAGFTRDTITVSVTSGAALPNVAPVARAGSDVAITLPVNKAALNGTQSTDADGNISSYQWTKVSGPAQHTFVNASAATTDISNLVEGTYVIKLKVTDNKGATSEDELTIRVNPAALPPNKNPVARAGNDITISLPLNKVKLDGSSSSDPDGTISAYKWSRVSGPTEFAIANSNAASTDVSSLVEGTYEFRLRVTDNRGGIHDDNILVKVNPAPPPPNKAPVAEAGPDITITLPVNQITIDAGYSYDSDGEIKYFRWSYISGPAYSISNIYASMPRFTGLQEGVYRFQLEVKDDDDAVGVDTVAITVNAATIPPPPPNKKPVAIINNSTFSITLPVNEVLMNGNSSYDTDGSIVSYAWSKISGPASYTFTTPSASECRIKNLHAGTYKFVLTVKDNRGALDSDTATVFVHDAPNMVPEADAGADILMSMPDPAIRLDGLGSNDPDGTIVRYAWTQVSGAGGITITNSNTTTPGVYGVKPGEYIFRLTVEDNDGATATDDVTLVVLPAKDTVPTDTIPDDNLKYEESISAFPNPAVSVVKINYTSEHEGTARISVYNMSGMLVHAGQKPKTQVQYQEEISVSHLQPGVYYVEVTVDGHRKITRFVKR